MFGRSLRASSVPVSCSRGQSSTSMHSLSEFEIEESKTHQARSAGPAAAVRGSQRTPSVTRGHGLAVRPA